MKRSFISCFLVAASVLAAVAQSPVDSAKVYFRIGHRQFDPTLGDNKATMDRFVDRVKQADKSDDIHHLVVRTYASPDGSAAANERLTRNRCDAITDHIVNSTGIDASLIKAYPEGVAWDELRRQVAENPDVPSREAVLEILDNTPVWIYDADGKIIDSRKNRLMSLNGGAPYNWLYQNIFPSLRNAVAVSLFLKSDVRAARDAAASAARAAANAAEAAAAAARAAAEASHAASNATSGIAEAIKAAEEAAAKAAKAADEASRAALEATEAAAKATAAADAAAVEDEVSGAKARAAEAEAARAVAEAAQASAEASRSAAEAARAAAEAIAAQTSQPSDQSDENEPSDLSDNLNPQGDPLHRFALKTNLLYYAALMPNIELQWRMNDLWTLSLEGNIAWYSKESKNKYYQLAMVSPEVRRWINPKGPWHGMYAGVFAGYTWYDLENGHTGYKGEGGLGGVSFGYMWPITRTLSLEAGIGVGYLYTRYREYIPYDGHYLYQRTKTTQYVGPLKLKFSLAWRFNDINKTKKAIPTL